MASAYVLITTKSGSERVVVEALRKLQEIKEMHILYGEYDIIARVQVSDI